jgi:dTDP-4-dehydrorhamnose reductase
MKALVVGADSAIGRGLMSALVRRGDSVIGTSRRSDATARGFLALDLAERNAPAALLPKADVVFFCAAMTGFRACRENPDLARAVNATAPVALARRLVGAGSRVVLLSTSAVFDWSTPLVPPGRKTCATSVYGRTKAEAEAGFLSFGRSASVIRFAKVLEPGAKLFLDWIDALRGGRHARAFSDLRMAPVSLDDALAALLAVADDPEGGIYQYSGAVDISYLDAARHLARRLGRDTSLVVEGFAREAGIPPEEITYFSSLDSGRVADLLGRAVPDPFKVIDAVFGCAGS